ncbi:MAG TPA: alpha/beta hydrolase [Pirellulaceae bacterium]|jgi:acetyl esterase/lipase
MHRTGFLLIALGVSQLAMAQEYPLPLKPAEAAKKVDQQVTVEFEVKSTGGGRNRYLNSEPDFSSANNFTIFIPQIALPKFAADKITMPDEHFYGKVIQVTGTVTQNRDKPQITVSDPAQIKIIDSKSGPPIHKKTHVYKQVSDLQIRADSYCFHDRPSQPVVVWIHGGALINGHRESVPAWLTTACRENGHVLVSLDYRLAPETQLPEIIQDIEDAFAWIRKDGPQLFQADPKKIAVVGGSAGGYLTLTAGFRVKPRPAALVSLWGYGDLVGPWYSQPSSHARHNTSKMSRDEAFQQVAGIPISDSRERKGNGGAFYQFCRQQGLWPKAVSGWDPRTEADKFGPFMPIKNVTPDYPPTLLIHGDKNTDVPYEQSELMAAALKKNKVEHQLLTIAGAEHGLAGADPEVIRAAYKTASEFLRQHLASP